MLSGVHIEHEVDESALELRAQAPIHRETCARDLGGAFQIENAEFRSEIPVWLGFEIELARLPPAANLDVFVRALADGHDLVRQVRDTGRQALEFVLRVRRLLVQDADAVADFANGCCFSAVSTPSWRSLAIASP